jgi:hypothetical protein
MEDVRKRRGDPSPAPVAAPGRNRLGPWTGSPRPSGRSGPPRTATITIVTRNGPWCPIPPQLTRIRARSQMGAGTCCSLVTRSRHALGLRSPTCSPPYERGALRRPTLFWEDFSCDQWQRRGCGSGGLP